MSVCLRVVSCDSLVFLVFLDVCVSLLSYFISLSLSLFLSLSLSVFPCVLSRLYSAQEVRSGFFQMFDYGSKGNEQHYGTNAPPLYRLQDVHVPTALVCVCVCVCVSRSFVVCWLCCGIALLS